MARRAGLPQDDPAAAAAYRGSAGVRRGEGHSRAAPALLRVRPARGFCVRLLSISQGALRLRRRGQRARHQTRRRRRGGVPTSVETGRCLRPRPRRGARLTVGGGTPAILWALKEAWTKVLG